MMCVLCHEMEQWELGLLINCSWYAREQLFSADYMNADIAAHRPIGVSASIWVEQLTSCSAGVIHNKYLPVCSTVWSQTQQPAVIYQ